MKPTFAGASLIVLTSCAVFAQSAPPSFEVASIKPAAPQQMGRMMTMMGSDPGRIDYKNVSLRDVLARAYNLKRSQVGGPSWMDTERYDITAKTPDGVPNEQVPLMLQALLADRFKMAIRKESKEEPVYALVVGKNGHKLKKSEDQENGPPAMVTAGRGGPGGPGMGRSGGGTLMKVNGPGGSAQMQATKITVARFADMLSDMLDRPVIDQTGIEGNYDIDLDVSLEVLGGMKRGAGGPMMPPPGAGGGDHGPAPEAAPAASIFSAIQSLGLKLEPRKAPVERIVVEKAERVPTEN